MISERNNNYDPASPQDQDAVMVYINPELMQTMANVSARKQRGFRELLRSAEDGDLDAAFRLGLSYAAGDDGAPQDDERAFYWFSKAADGDHITAVYHLGHCCARGTGTRRDIKRAVELFTQAADTLN